MCVFRAQFSTGQVVQATGVSNHVLQSWLKRQLVIGHHEGIHGGGSPGMHRRFTFRATMSIAVAKALIDAGLGSLEHAFKAAHGFSHTGRIEAPARVPGCPYDSRNQSGTTLIAVRGDRSVVYFWERGRDPLPEIIARVQGPEIIARVQGFGFVLIDADQVFRAVTKALGYDPAEILAQAYGPVNNR